MGFRAPGIVLDWPVIVPLIDIQKAAEERGPCSFSAVHLAQPSLSTKAAIYWNRKNPPVIDDPQGFFCMSVGGTKIAPNYWVAIQGLKDIRNSARKAFVKIAEEHVEIADEQAQSWSSGASSAAGSSAAAAGERLQPVHLLQSEDLQRETAVVDRAAHLAHLQVETIKGVIPSEVARKGPTMDPREIVPRSVVAALHKEAMEKAEAAAELQDFMVNPEFGASSFQSPAALEVMNFDHSRKNARGHAYVTGPPNVGKSATAIAAMHFQDPGRRPVLHLKGVQLPKLALGYEMGLKGKDIISGIAFDEVQFDVDRLEALGILSGGHGDGICTIPVVWKDKKGRKVKVLVHIDKGTPIIFLNNPETQLFKDPVVMNDPAISGKDGRLYEIQVHEKVYEAQRGPPVSEAYVGDDASASQPAAEPAAPSTFH